MLDLIHRIYEADESFRSLNFMVHTKLYFSQIGAPDPGGHADPDRPTRPHPGAQTRRHRSKTNLCYRWMPDQIGVFAMRWNVVIGGQLFSKSFPRIHHLQDGLVTREGLLMSVALTLLPLFILWALVKLLPPWPETGNAEVPLETRTR